MSKASPSESIHKIERGDDLARGRDLAAENRAKLAELFPGLITETVDIDGNTIPGVDADALRDLVGATVEGDSREKFGLSWHGKAAARRLALTPSTGTLRPCPGDDESVDWDTTKNIMIEGDNLEVLKLLQKSYAGRVKLIYIDPPYNTGKDFVYKDNFRDPLGQYERYTGQRGEDGEALVNKENRDSGGRFHTDWLNMIYPRLLLARELLREDGVIFVSVDDNEIHHLRKTLDEIFGEENFISEIVWKKSYGGGAKVKHVVGLHEYIVMYARSAQAIPTIDLPPDPETRKYYKYQDSKYETRGPYRTQPLAANSNDFRPNLRYPIEWKGEKILPEKQWQWAKERTDAALANDELVIKSKNGKWSVEYKQYLRDEDGTERSAKLFSLKVKPYTQAGTKEVTELLGDAKAFPFPKPSELIRHLLSILWKDKDAIILDFFAGSGTTGHAVMAQNAADGGNRRYVLVQLPEPTGRDDYPTIAELTKERLRRAGRKIREEHEGKLGAATSGGELDTGFRVFKLDTANVKAWDAPTTDQLEPGEINNLLEESVDGVKLDRTDEDLLWGAMLNLGLPLDGTIDPRKIDTPAGETTVYVAGACTLLACFAKSIDRQSGEALAQGLADLIKKAKVEGDVTILLRDSAFAGDDAVKVNLVENLRQHAPDADKVRVLSI